MFQIFQCYYEQTSRHIFDEDLANKLDVILLRGKDGCIHGFSTLSVISYEEHGCRGRAIFSGDTIIQHEYWGTQALPLAFASYAAGVKSERPDELLYWFLISKGYRTYRYLPLLFHKYYPRYDAATPLPAQRLMNLLAEKKFGDCYDAATGVVCFPSSRGQLRGDWARVPDAALRKPEVRFFLQRNPGYAQGNELVCLAELSVENLRSVGRRRFEEMSHVTAT